MNVEIKLLYKLLDEASEAEGSREPPNPICTRVNMI